MTPWDRRAFLQSSSGTLLAYALLDTLFERQAFADPVKPIMADWLKELNELSISAQQRTLPQTDWQIMVEKLMDRVDLPELLRAIEFDKILSKGPLPDVGARSYPFRFPKVAGVSDRLAFGKQIFGLKSGRSVVPHGHNNMVTAFLILQGTFHGRHYDRLANEPDHCLIKPTIDRPFSVGEHSSISDEKDNVHWFQATQDGSYIFNIHVYGVSPQTGEPTGRIYLDPNGEKVSDGNIRARRLRYEEAHRLYG
jgi:hypothetical protein